MPDSENILYRERLKYKPRLPDVLNKNILSVGFKTKPAVVGAGISPSLQKLFPNLIQFSTVEIAASNSNKGDSSSNSNFRIGVVLGGGQAPGGHNVIAGLYDAIKKFDDQNSLVGFLGGSEGLLKGQFIEITGEMVDSYRNTGGFDLIGSGRGRLDDSSQFAICGKMVEKLKLDGVVFVGGHDTNTNAAMLAEYFLSAGIGCKVIGVPKTIDGDLRSTAIEIPFGFDTATKVYTELVGNIMKDAISAKKYWHFIKLMGRTASHIALEVALRTKPNVVLISEEIQAKGMTLSQITNYIIKIILDRVEKGYSFGVVLIPEGLIGFVPEVKMLISEINNILDKRDKELQSRISLTDKTIFIQNILSTQSSMVFKSIPFEIQKQLIMERDPHCNVQVSLIDTERLLIYLLTMRMKELRMSGEFKEEFLTQRHFFGYEGRCGYPTNFDADYTYSLGMTAFLLIRFGLTGYMAHVSGLKGDVKDWRCGGVPFSYLLEITQRYNEEVPSLKKSFVSLESKSFKTLAKLRESWALENDYSYPGPIQYFGVSELVNQRPKTLELDDL